MITLLLAMTKASLVLGVAVAAAALLRRRSAALRHWLLATGFLLAAVTVPAGAMLPATPLVSWTVPGWTVPGWTLPGWIVPAGASSTSTSQAIRLTSEPLDLATASRVESAPAASTWTTERFVLLAWLVGALIALASLGMGMLRLGMLARRATPVRRPAWLAMRDRIAAGHGIRRPVLVLQSAHPVLLVTWGLRRPKILLPAAARFWSDDRIAIVLHHELAHVGRADWVVQLGAAIVRALCWFNPLVWLAYRRLRQASEHACDDLVLRQGVDSTAYATHLVEIARAFCHSRRVAIPAPAVAHPSTLEQRIRAMLNPTCDRTSPTLFTRTGTSLALATAALAVATGALSAKTPTTTDDIVLSNGNTVQRMADDVQDGLPQARPARVPGAAGITPGFAAADQVPAPAVAQPGRGSFSGAVFDQIGGLTPGADVVLTNEQTGGAVATVTDPRGAFEFKDLRPGRYAIEVQLAGFQNVKATIVIAPNAHETRRIVLPVGTLQETIMVTGQRGAAVAPAAVPARPAASPNPAADADTRRSLEQLFEAVNNNGSSFRPGSRGGMIKAPMKLLHVNPIYPASMQASGGEGLVSLVGRIGSDGHVLDVQEARQADANPPVHPDLVEAAMTAVRGWRFTPTLLNNVPVEVTVMITVQFSLR